MIRIKPSDLGMATASLVLVGLILYAVLLVAFIPLNSSSSSDLLSLIIAFLATSLVVGYAFALKIQEESRLRAVFSIAVLSALALLLFNFVLLANPLIGPWFKESLQTLFDTSGWTSYQWASYASLLVSMDVIISLLLSFIGLYAGSMLRKTKH